MKFICSCSDNIYMRVDRRRTRIVLPYLRAREQSGSFNNQPQACLADTCPVEQQKPSVPFDHATLFLIIHFIDSNTNAIIPELGRPPRRTRLWRLLSDQGG